MLSHCCSEAAPSLLPETPFLSQACARPSPSENSDVESRTRGDARVPFLVLRSALLFDACNVAANASDVAAAAALSPPAPPPPDGRRTAQTQGGHTRAGLASLWLQVLAGVVALCLALLS